jgi:GNAT superfamily N-acetyltransferase
MFVVDSARRRHIGTALIDEFRHWSLERGANEIYVSAAFDNQRAMAFYQSNGFASYSHDLIMDLRQ